MPAAARGFATRGLCLTTALLPLFVPARISAFAAALTPLIPSRSALPMGATDAAGPFRAVFGADGALIRRAVAGPLMLLTGPHDDVDQSLSLFVRD